MFIVHCLNLVHQFMERNVMKCFKVLGHGTQGQLSSCMHISASIFCPNDNQDTQNQSDSRKKKDLVVILLYLIIFTHR